MCVCEGGGALEYAALPVALHEVPVLNLAMLNWIPDENQLAAKQGGKWGEAVLVAVVLRCLKSFVPDKKVEVIDAT